jgi:hypothetical protein
VLLDRDRADVQVFTTSGTFVAKYFGPGAGNSQLSSPQDIYQSSTSGHYFVADKSNHRVQEYDEDFTYVRTYGSGNGTSDGQMNFPLSVVEKEGELFVLDGNGTPSYRISAYSSSTGVFSRAFNSKGLGVGLLYASEILRVDYFGRLLVSEPGAAHRIQLLDSLTGAAVYDTR